MNIFLLRHGDTLEFGFEDLHRPLSSIGERQAQVAGEYLRLRREPPRVIFASPYLRTKQTAEIISVSLGIGEINVTTNLVPGFDDRFLLDELLLYPPASALLVGHEPQLRSFSHFLTGERAAGIDLRKGSLLCIGFREGVAKGKGKLRKALMNEEMELLAAKR